MAPGALQLFPPPERSQQRQIPPKWPARASSRRELSKLQVPDHLTERMEGAKSQADFHELVIRINSAPTSPAEMELSHIEAPKRAHLPNHKTPPQQSYPIFNSPSRSHTPTDMHVTSNYGARAISPDVSETYSMRSGAVSPPNAANSSQRRMASPTPPVDFQQRRMASPTPSERLISPVSIASTQRRGVSPTPYEDMHGVIGLAISPEAQQNPGHRRVASPAESDVLSARSSSPTLVRSNSTVTASSKRSLPGPPPGGPVMRSMFPTYNPDVPLSQQSYKPMLTTPPSRIPREKINRPLNSPKYTPHGNIESLEDDDPAPRLSAAIPYYTPPTALDSLWNATNGQGNPVVQVYTLQIHRKASGYASGESQLVFGPSESQPFYTLSHTDLPPATMMDEDDQDDADHELLITRHNPSKPGSFPIAHFALSPTPLTTARAMTLAAINQVEEHPTLITTIYPKMAALTALDAAAHSPAASHIALMDPDASSPAAERLAQDVLLGTAQRECCALVWTRTGHSQAARFASASTGTYALHHPSLGTFPVTHEGDMGPGLSPILGPAPFSSTKPRPARINKPTRITVLNPFATPADQRRPDTPSDDGVLARLDFGTDSLTLNVAAIMRLGNPYLIDVIVSTLLAVALAEEKRVRREIRFDAPPVLPSPSLRANSSTPDSAAEKKGFWHRVGKRAEKKAREKIKIDSGIDLEAWGAPPKEPIKEGKKTEDLPFLTTAILGILTFTFKTAVWILTVGIKIIGGVVVKVSHWIVNKA